MPLTSSHCSPRGAKPVVRPQAGQSADPHPPEESGSSRPPGTKEVGPRQAGKMAAQPRDCRESLTQQGPYNETEEGRRRGKDESKLGHLFSGSLPVGHLGQAVGLSRWLRRSFLYNTLFWILITASSPCRFGPRGGNSSTVIPWVSLYPAHIFANPAC